MENIKSFEQAANDGDAILLLGDAKGIYIPRDFCQSFVVNEPDLDEDVEICATDPDSDDYWEAWANILDHGTITNFDGRAFRLMQDGDLWAVAADVEIDWEV